MNHTSKQPLKIMYLSPVTDSSNDALFANAAAQCKNPDTEIHVTSLPPDAGVFSHIELRSYEAMVTPFILRAVRAAAADGFDALAIGCFYDTALEEAREVSGTMHVVGPCSSSCEIAASLANRFGIIVGRRKWVHQMQSTVDALGHGPKLSGFYHVGLGVTEFQEDHERTATLLQEAGRKAVEQDYAEALILGCTMEIGFHEEMATELGIPVIDPSIALIKRAEYAAALKRNCGLLPSRKWSCEPPSDEEMESTGVFGTQNAYITPHVVAATPST